MRVLTIISNIAMGGAQRMAYELVKNLNQQEFMPFVLCYGEKLGNTLEEQMEGICPTYYLGYSGHINMRTIIKVLKEISSLNPDMIHAHMGGIVFAVLWGILHRKPVLITVHTDAQKAFRPQVHFLVKIGILCGKVRLVAVSKDNYLQLIQYFPQRICSYVNNGIDIGRFYKTPHKGFTYLNVAWQNENKNQVALLRVFKKIHDIYPDTKLVLVGNGPLHQHLLALREKFELLDCVDIPGESSTVEKYYALADVYVQTSHQEAMPLSILEALATGLPIISTQVGGIKDVVDGNGILVPDGDEDALFSAMKTILSSSPDQYYAMGKKSKDLSANYSSRNMAQQYSALYYQILTEKNN